ncbi:traU family protein [Salmonella enterica]|nr:traU family protein [Salmonella enterica]EBR8648633.1 traU family protein [Salmonella enterica subsp. enterica serovar Muenchen]EDT7035986.1 traU family protein [Salmonella enterica subsp. enterica serovar Soahanina]EGZ4409306.1 traU family protein [Salmonella enterica subsp. enterica serovar Poona]EAZ5467368.1 traU family protein [Salmonella enterica]
MCYAVFSDCLLKTSCVNIYTDSGQCHPFGRSVTRRETGKNPPNTKKNFGYLMWRKRNCVFL